MDSSRFKEIMRTQVCYGAKNISLSFETAGQLYQALEQAEQAVARVEKLLKDSEEVESVFASQHDRIWIDCVRRALDGEQA